MGRVASRVGLRGVVVEIALGNVHAQAVAIARDGVHTGPHRGGRTGRMLAYALAIGALTVRMPTTLRASTAFAGPHPGPRSVGWGAVGPPRRPHHRVRDVTLRDDEGRTVAQGTVRFRVLEGRVHLAGGEILKRPTIASVCRAEARGTKGTRRARTAM